MKHINNNLCYILDSYPQKTGQFIMYSSPNHAALMAIRVAETEQTRFNEQRINNLNRFIAYNNRRIRAGLRPLDAPAALSGQWERPVNRDSIALTER